MKRQHYIIILIVFAKIAQGSFTDIWATMRREYRQLYIEFREKQQFKKEIYYHPFWEKKAREIMSLILGSPRPDFLHCPAITSTMVRNIDGGALDRAQYHEVCYLNHCVKAQTHQAIKKFKEPVVGNAIISCPEYNCSTNSLGQLYYAARILEKVTSFSAVQTIVEFGAGFGNLAYIFKTLLPDATIIIFDLPELLAIQYMYLSLALPGAKPIIHHEAPISFEKGIHLIPVFLLSEVNVEANVFVSNFALSEATTPVQQMVVEKDFFNASISYITGQLHGWREGFVNQRLIHESMRMLYSTIDCVPFHIFLPGKCESYELIATR